MSGDKKAASLAISAHDGRMWTPKQMLEHGISEIDSGERQCTKAIVITLDDSKGRYNTGFLQSGMSVSQILGLLEVFKARLLSDEDMI